MGYAFSGRPRPSPPARPRPVNRATGRPTRGRGEGSDLTSPITLSGLSARVSHSIDGAGDDDESDDDDGDATRAHVVISAGPKVGGEQGV